MNLSVYKRWLESRIVLIRLKFHFRGIKNGQPDTKNNIPFMDIAEFLVKDLLKERFYKFDKPEHNISGKYTFKSIVPEF
jgi:hypothetical protein